MLPCHTPTPTLLSSQWVAAIQPRVLQPTQADSENAIPPHTHRKHTVGEQLLQPPPSSSAIQCIQTTQRFYLALSRTKLWGITVSQESELGWGFLLPIRWHVTAAQEYGLP